MSKNPTASNWTEIAFILDSSGSMESIKQGTIEGFNAFLSQQQQEHEKYPALFSLTLFNTRINEVISSEPVVKVPVLDTNNYSPTDGTALLDAIGITVDSIGKRLASLPEAERPGKVIIAIMTDGEENSSRVFNWDQISEKIKHQTEVYKWEFLFLGANQDAIATASKMNIDRGSSLTYFQQDGSARRAMQAASSSVSWRKMRLPVTKEQEISAFYAKEETKEQSEK
jgi:hypothetical protein